MSSSLCWSFLQTPYSKAVYRGAQFPIGRSSIVRVPVVGPKPKLDAQVAETTAAEMEGKKPVAPPLVVPTLKLVEKDGQQRENGKRQLQLMEGLITGK